MLRTLYYETELLLTGGFSEVSRAERTQAARERLADALSRLAANCGERYARLHYENYLLTVDLQDQLRHAEFVRAADDAGKKLATMVTTHEFEAVPKSPCWRRTIRACFRSSPAPARRRAATSSTRRSSPPPTAARWTRS